MFCLVANILNMIRVEMSPKDIFRRITVKSGQRREVEIIQRLHRNIPERIQPEPPPLHRRLCPQVSLIVGNGDEERTWQRSQKQPTAKRSWTPPRAPIAPS